MQIMALYVLWILFSHFNINQHESVLFQWCLDLIFSS